MRSGCSFVQAVAAAQAGVSVIQPNIGRLADWYKQNPGAIKDPRVSLRHAPKLVLPQHPPAYTPKLCHSISVPACVCAGPPLQIRLAQRLQPRLSCGTSNALF